MQHRKTLSGLIAAPLVIVAIAAPAAQAMPADPRQLDMHASTVQKSESATQDLRSENAADTSRVPVSPQTSTPAPTQDLRGEAAADKSPVPAPPIGLPVWPRNPEPIVPVSQEPVATGGGDDGIEWPLSGIVIAAALLLGGTLGVAGTRYRVSHAHAA